MRVGDKTCIIAHRRVDKSGFERGIQSENDALLDFAVPEPAAVISIQLLSQIKPSIFCLWSCLGYHQMHGSQGDGFLKLYNPEKNRGKRKKQKEQLPLSGLLAPNLICHQ